MKTTMAIIATCCVLSCSSTEEIDGEAVAVKQEDLHGSRYNMVHTDYELLWTTARNELEEYGITRADKSSGILETRDFVRYDFGVPIYGYVEVRCDPDPGAPGGYRLEVLAYRFEKRFAGDDPFSREGKGSFRFVGLDQKIQDDLARRIYRAYLSSRVSEGS